jgi:hypothetical protein
VVREAALPATILMTRHGTAGYYRVRRSHAIQRLYRDDFGSNRSKIMNVIESNILRSGMRAENRYTLFLFPL